MDNEDRFANPREAEGYIRSNELPGPIEIRFVTLPKAILKVRGLTNEEFGALFRETLQDATRNSPLRDYAVIKAFLEGSDFSFRSFARPEPYRDDSGNWIYPSIHPKYKFGSIIDVFYYINSIGMEFDSSTRWIPSEHMIGEWYVDELFYSNLVYPLSTYMTTLGIYLGEFLTCILVYRENSAKKIRTPWIHEYVKLSLDEEGPEVLNTRGLYFGTTIKDQQDSPTLRDSLVGMLVITWI